MQTTIAGKKNRDSVNLGAAVCAVFWPFGRFQHQVVKGDGGPGAGAVETEREKETVTVPGRAQLKYVCYL